MLCLIQTGNPSFSANFIHIKRNKKGAERHTGPPQAQKRRRKSRTSSQPSAESPSGSTPRKLVAWFHGLDAQDQVGRTGRESGIFLKTLSCYSDSFQAYDLFGGEHRCPWTLDCSVFCSRGHSADVTKVMAGHAGSACRSAVTGLLRKHCSFFFFLKIYLFLIFGHTLQHVRSQFPDQGLNPQPLH